MATRKRIIYQSQAVEVATTDGVLNSSIPGVQSANYGIDVSREDVNQFGVLGAYNRVIMEAPTASAEFSCYVNAVPANGLNSLISEAVSGKNATVRFNIGAEGQDYATAGTNETVTLTSGSMTSFSAEASVGAVPTMTFGFEGTDLNYTYNAISPPAASGCDVAVQQDVLLEFDGVEGYAGAGGANPSGHMAYCQSANLSFDLGLEALADLGDANAPFLYARVPSYPASASLTVEALAVDRGMGIIIGNLKQKASASTGDNDGGFCNVNLKMGQTKFRLINATLDSVNFTSSLGDNATCDATFGCSIGGALSTSKLTVVQS